MSQPYSFYGGPAGQSFEIKEVFKSRYGTSIEGITDSMEYDLSRGWTSPIGVGEYVMISYGLPNDENYDTYKSRDINHSNKTYNSTLWQKVYNELDGTANGLDYKLLSSMTGNTPRLIIETPSEVLNADEEPDVIFDGSDIDVPKIKFQLPQSQILSLKQPTNILDVDEKPKVVYDESVNINRPTLEFFLPQSQRISKAIVEDYLDVNESPEVRIDITEDGNINEPVLKFKLPVTQEFIEENIVHDVLDADVKPYVTFDTSKDINKPIITFHLPQSQVMQQPELEVLDPSADPSVIDTGTVNEPQLTFKLPRGIEFYYGSLLGERNEGTYILSNEAFVNYGVGDYYINAETGFIYKVIAKDGATCTFEYIACIQAPLPEIKTTPIDLYDEEGNRTSPQVKKIYINTEQTQWQLEFILPEIPNFQTSYEFIGASEKGSVSVNPVDTNAVDFHFSIPGGSNIYAGIDIEELDVDKIKPGDIFLNTETGYVYKLSLNKEWEQQEESLKGPVGESLHIVRDYDIQETGTLRDSLESGVEYILEHYVDENGDPLPLSSDEIFSITWMSYIDDDETSYWYYYTDEGVWGRVQLTSGVSNLFKSEYEDEINGPVINKTYSIHYINKLIGGEKKNDDTDDLTTFSKEQLYDMLSWGKF